jgi:hypothetical protein
MSLLSGSVRGLKVEAAMERRGRAGGRGCGNEVRRWLDGMGLSTRVDGEEAWLLNATQGYINCNASERQTDCKQKRGVKLKILTFVGRFNTQSTSCETWGRVQRFAWNSVTRGSLDVQEEYDGNGFERNTTRAVAPHGGGKEGGEAAVACVRAT